VLTPDDKIVSTRSNGPSTSSGRTENCPAINSSTVRAEPVEAPLADRSSDYDPFPPAADAERALDRRRFLCAAGAATLLTLAGEWVGRGAATARTRALAVRLDAADPVAVGEARAFADLNGGEALVVRLDAATVVGFDRRCPHLGCPVLWAAERGRFECPCHHAAFDARTGRVLFGPPRRGLEPVIVRTA
jgi:nitrite reductase/ring-hydroxylating ferredoxin subunit